MAQLGNDTVGCEVAAQCDNVTVKQWHSVIMHSEMMTQREIVAQRDHVTEK